MLCQPPIAVRERHIVFQASHHPFSSVSINVVHDYDGHNTLSASLSVSPTSSVLLTLSVRGTPICETVAILYCTSNNRVRDSLATSLFVLAFSLSATFKLSPQLFITTWPLQRHHQGHHLLIVKPRHARPPHQTQSRGARQHVQLFLQK